MTGLITNQRGMAMNLVCLRKHVWPSPILGCDWAGPIFAEAFCPECELRGKRVPYEEDDFDGFVSKEDCEKIGERALFVFAFIYLRLREIMLETPAGEPVRSTMSLETIIKGAFDAGGKIVESLERLRAFEYLKITEIPKFEDKFRTEFSTDPAERRFTIEWGPKVRLVRLLG